jgi:predicted butyrate kinase (DUF1464 family)
MPRVIGIDPGTVSIDLCGLDAGKLFLDRSLPTSETLAHPSSLIELLEEALPLDLVVGPSGYGLPLSAARDLTDDDFRLAYLAAERETGGIAGLRSLVRTLTRFPAPVVLTPGVVHLASVPSHRKVNRVDMGTADKVCSAALAIHEQTKRRACEPRDVSLVLLELGGAFSAAVAVKEGRIVDGAGGTSGPIGARAAGALDGEVAFLAGSVSKQMLFGGGAATIAGEPEAPAEALARTLADPTTEKGHIARQAFLESAAKAVAVMTVSAPGAQEIILSGRLGRAAGVRDELARRLAAVIPGATVHLLEGLAAVAKEGAQGAALIADGLAGGAHRALVDVLGIREARGTVLDHLHVVSAASARARLGMT